jgi:hypothetical protein
MKYIFLFLVIISFGFSQEVQFDLSESPYKLTIKNIFNFSSTNKKIKTITNSGLMLYSSEEGLFFTKRKFYLTDIYNPKSKELIFSEQKKSYKEDAEIISSGRIQYFKYFDNGKIIAEIYDTVIDTTIFLENEDGDIDFVDAITIDKILYKVVPTNYEQETGRPLIYLKCRNEDKDKFVAQGLRILWSPDGKYFFAQTYASPNLIAHEKLKYEDLSKSEKLKIIRSEGIKEGFEWRACIYDSLGQIVKEISELNECLSFHSNTTWSPDSKNLVIQGGCSAGFYIVPIEKEGNVFGENIYHFKSFSFPNGRGSYLGKPSWSIDCSKISFEVIEGDGYQEFDKNVYIADISKKIVFKATNYVDCSIANTYWTSDKKLFVIREKYGVQKIDELELN